MSDLETAAAAPRDLTDEEAWAIMLAEFGPGRSAELVGWMALMMAAGVRPSQSHALRQWFVDRGMNRRTAYRAINDLCRVRELFAEAEGRPVRMEDLPAIFATKLAHRA